MEKWYYNINTRIIDKTISNFNSNNANRNDIILEQLNKKEYKKYNIYIWWYERDINIYKNPYNFEININKMNPDKI